jgi:uncharacterized protein YndB with AHSA1/START domain
MKTLKGLVYLASAVVVLGLTAGLFLPTSAHVERSITTTASPQTVFELVNGFRRFNEWSPWAQLDHDAKYTFSGPDTGVGARMEWTSDKPDVGSGSQEIIAVEPGRSVTNALDFGQQGRATARLTLTPEAVGTRVVWAFDTSFEGHYFQRYFGLLMDRFIGPDYEKGLARLKQLAEAGTPAEAPAISAPEVAESAAPATTAMDTAGTATSSRDS